MFTRIAEELESIADKAETKALEETLASCGITADEDSAESPIFEETEKDDTASDEEMIAKIAKATDDFIVQGVNGTEQDEFTQCQEALGYGKGKADYNSVAEAAKKYASCARELHKIEAACKDNPENAKYLPYVAAMKRTLQKRTARLMEAVADKTPFCGDLGSDSPRPEKGYGEYDKQKPAMDAEKTSTSHPWKTDSHDEIGFGVEKTQKEVTRSASEKKLAATKSVRLAVCLLGSKTPEDVITAQSRDFYASLTLAQIDGALKRFAETQDLYQTEEKHASETVESPVTTDKELTAEDKTEVVEAPAVTGEGKTEDVPAMTDEVFSPDEEKEIEDIKASIVARQAKLKSEAERRASEELGKDAEEVVCDEVKTAVEDVTESADPVVEDEGGIDLDMDVTDGTDAETIQELEDSLNGGEADKTASVVEKKPQFVQKLGGFQKLASTGDNDLDELSRCWLKPGEEFFA